LLAAWRFHSMSLYDASLADVRCRQRSGKKVTSSAFRSNALGFMAPQPPEPGILSNTVDRIYRSLYSK